jgi:hypothetical protein
MACRVFMIWVHGPRYLQARYPDHETLARYDWFVVICAFIQVGLFEKGRHYYGTRALAGRSGRRVQVSLSRKSRNAAWPLPQHAISRRI